MNAKQRRQLERYAANRTARLAIRANADLPKFLQCSGGNVEWIEAAPGADGASKLKKFSGIAYAGGPMNLGWGRPVVVDLQGLTAGSAIIPALKDHDATNIVGHGSVEIGARQVKFSGEVSGLRAGVENGAQEVVALAANGFQWQMSIGAEPGKIDRVEAGEKVLVNGRNVHGPAYVVRAASLREVSFLSIGADGATSASIAAQLGSIDMGFSAWLAAKGLDEKTLDAKVLAVLKASYDAEIKAKADADAEAARIAAGGAPAPKPDAKPATGSTSSAEPPKPIDIESIVAQAVQAAVGAVTSESEIAGVYASFEKAMPKDKLDSIKATAKANKWNRDRIELECRREARPGAPGIHSYAPNTGAPVLSAAFRRALTQREDEKSFDAPTLEASRRQFRSGIGLQQIIEIQARANGWHGHRYRDDEEGCLRAAFSTIELPNILTVNFNYVLLAAYNAVEDSWRQIARIGLANDFKTMTRYRMTADVTFEVVGAAGELAHGSVGEQTYTNQVDTYGRIFKIPRKELVNDNLNAFATLAQLIGRGGALKVNKVFWTAFMSGTGTFWHTSHATVGDTGNANYATGAGTALAIAGLSQAELMFYNQVDPGGNPLGVSPRKLVVPNALNVTATQLMRDTEVRDTTASTKYTTGNPHAGKFDVVRSTYLSDASITGYSALAWYLTADPMDLPLIEMAFLNGQQTPTVEQAQADFDTLGLQMRGFFDFGAAKQDFRAGVKMKGEA